MEFNCNVCNYSSHDKFNYKRHEKSKKHREKVAISPNISLEYPKDISCDSLNYTCNYCDMKFTKSCNLSRHKNICSGKHELLNRINEQNILIIELKKSIFDKEKEIHSLNMSLNCPNVIIEIPNKQEFKCFFCNIVYANSANLSRHKNYCNEKYLTETNIKLIEKDKLIDQKDEIISILKSENAHLKMIVNNAGSVIKTSVSTMAYVIKNFKEAPALESIKDYSAIHFEQNNTAFVENLIYEQNHNKLHIYIGDFIIKTYKKEDPSKQSIWNSDTSRLTYLIREIISNNKVDWKIDKKGIKTKNFIIEPILEYIDNQIRDFIENFDMDYTLDSAKSAERKMMQLKISTDILKNIEDKLLSEEILKYVAPHFYLSKNDELIET